MCRGASAFAFASVSVFAVVVDCIPADSGGRRRCRARSRWGCATRHGNAEAAAACRKNMQDTILGKAREKDSRWVEEQVVEDKMASLSGMTKSYPDDKMRSPHHVTLIWLRSSYVRSYLIRY